MTKYLQGAKRFPFEIQIVAKYATIQRSLVNNEYPLRCLHVFALSYRSDQIRRTEPC